MALVDAQLTDALRLIPGEDVVLQRGASTSDALRVGDLLLTNYGAVVREVLRVREQLIGNGIETVTLRDAMRVVDQLFSAREAVVSDAVLIAQSQAVQSAILLLERLKLSEALQGNGIYQLTLRQSLRLVDKLARFFGVDVVEALGLQDADFARLLAAAAVTEGVGVSAAIAPQLLLNVVVSDKVRLEPHQLVRAIFAPHVVEGIEVKAGYLAPDGSLTTWAMNTRTGAVTEYANYGFNSFAQLGRRYLGASANGLYELLGDDDDGDDIIARIKGGFMQFGGTQLSRLKEAYIAVRNDGDFVLRVIEGDGRVYAYAVSARSMRSTKVHMGKGMRARYFAFELISAGQDFDLDTLEFVPLVVQRRV